MVPRKIKTKIEKEPTETFNLGAIDKNAAGSSPPRDKPRVES